MNKRVSWDTLDEILRGSEMKNLIERYLEYVSDRINNWDYTDIDAYCEDEELDDKEIGILLDIPMKVVQQGEIDRLKKDLKCYGRHGRICKSFQGKDCDCGYDQALKEGE